jgi:hypothetical protein
MGTALVVWRKWTLPRMHKIAKPSRRTICNVLDELSQGYKARGDALGLQKVEECYDMARRMQTKLTKYNANEKLSSLHDVDGVTGDVPSA